MALLAFALLAAGCGNPTLALPPPPSISPAGDRVVVSPVAGYSDRAPSPSPSAIPSPATIPAAYGVLVDLKSDPLQYTVSLVDAHGDVTQQFSGGKRTVFNTHNGQGLDMPYVSTTLTSVYFLDVDSLLVRGRPDGQRTKVRDLGVPSGSEAAFAVSPDDRQIAVTLLDFTTYPVHLTLYTDALTGGHKKVIYQSTSNYVWPVAWHGGLLVLAHAAGPFDEDIRKAAPARENPYGAISYHLVDPTNANRKVLMGACTVSGPLSPAGSACIQGGVIDWHGNDPGPWSTSDWGQRSSAAAVSPSGQWVAAADPNHPGDMAIWRRDGTIANHAAGTGNLYDSAGWLDDQTLIVGSFFDGNWQPTIENVIRGGYVYAVPAHGFYAARLPTDIG